MENATEKLGEKGFQHEWRLYSPYSRVRDNSSSSVIVFLSRTESCQTDRPHTKFTRSLVSLLAIYLHCSCPGNHHNIPRSLPHFTLSLRLVVKPALRKATSAQGRWRPWDVQVPGARWRVGKHVFPEAERVRDGGGGWKTKCLWLRRT